VVAHPFGPLPTWREFFDRLRNEFDVTVRLFPDPYHDDEGDAFLAAVLQRIHPHTQRVLRRGVMYEALDARVQPSVIRSTCEALGIDNWGEAFGLTLEFDEDPPPGS
jgi:hypothetical protein